jgi:fructose-1,6-bisphosphatase/inositol monophosphatase family enzyme
VPVIEGAGGVITDWQGKSINLETDDRILAAANSELHQAALSVIN